MRGGSRDAARGYVAIALVVSFVLCDAACGGTDFAHRASPSGPGPNPTGVVAESTVATPAVHDVSLQAKVQAAVARTRARRTARTSVSVTLTGVGDRDLSTAAFDVAGSGVVDLVHGDADLTLSVPRFDRFSGGGTVEERIVGGVAYARLPPRLLRAAGMPAGVVWLSLDRGRVTEDRAASSQSQVDPAGQFAFLAAASEDVRTVGDEAVRGEAATHYTLRIDAVALTVGGAPGAVVRARLARLGSALGSGPVVVDAWLDTSGCARRIVVSVPLRSPSAPAGRGDSTLRIQDDYFGFGIPVSAAVPAPSAVRPYRTLRLAAATG